MEKPNRSTPKTRLAQAMRDYEREASRLGSDIAGRRPRKVPSAPIGPGSERTLPTEEDGDISFLAVSGLDTEKASQDVYGAGRELEKAIQLARFYYVTGNGGADWIEGLRR